MSNRHACCLLRILWHSPLLHYCLHTTKCCAILILCSARRDYERCHGGHGPAQQPAVPAGQQEPPSAAQELAHGVLRPGKGRGEGLTCWCASLIELSFTHSDSVTGIRHRQLAWLTPPNTYTIHLTAYDKPHAQDHGMLRVQPGVAGPSHTVLLVQVLGTTPLSPHLWYEALPPFLPPEPLGGLDGETRVSMVYINIHVSMSGSQYHT